MIERIWIAKRNRKCLHAKISKLGKDNLKLEEKDRPLLVTSKSQEIRSAWIFKDHPILARRVDIVVINKKKLVSWLILSFLLNTVKIKENKNTNTCTLSESWKFEGHAGNGHINYRRILRTVHEGPKKKLSQVDIRGRIEIILTTAPLKSIRIVKRVMVTLSVLLNWHQMRLVWKPTVSKKINK